MASRDPDRGRSPVGYGGGSSYDPNYPLYGYYDFYGGPGYGRGASVGGTGTGGGGGGVPLGGPEATTTGTTGATTAGTASALGSAGGWLRLAGQLAPILSSIAGGRAEGRQQAGQANQAQARAQADIFRTRMDAALTGPRRSAEDAARGDTMANIQPFRWTGETAMSGNIPIPQSTGGMTPANFGPATRSAGRDLATQGASRVTSPSFALPQPPELADLPQAGMTDSILGNSATVAALLSTLGVFNNRGRNTTGNMPRTQDDPGWDTGYG